MHQRVNSNIMRRECRWREKTKQEEEEESWSSGATWIKRRRAVDITKSKNGSTRMRGDVPHRSLRAKPRHREQRNLTADSKAINHKAINVTPWDGYATVITYTRDLYNPGSDVSLSSFVRQSRTEDLYARPARIVVERSWWQSNSFWVSTKA